MRSPVMLFPVMLTLLRGDAGSPRALARDTELAFMEAFAPQPADTGDSLLTWGRYRSLLLTTSGDSNRLPRTECPMPVVRPDPGVSVLVPTNERHPARDSAVFFSGPHTNVSRMPVVRSGCWNPLDQPERKADSVWIDGIPSPHR
ncbi:MAG: hypothetical protein ABI742_00555 [Gemmatimonadota bacterium]